MDWDKQKKMVADLLLTRLDPERWSYHTWWHTEAVIADVELFAREAGVSDEEFLLLRLAALYHDCGYVFDPEQHEAASAVFAGEQLAGGGLSLDQICLVQKLIRATRVPCDPGSLLEELICDADLGRLGTPDFSWCAVLLRKELAAGGKVFSDVEWFEFEVNFLERMRYFSAAARRLRRDGVARNLELMRRELAAAQSREKKQ